MKILNFGPPYHRPSLTQHFPYGGENAAAWRALLSPTYSPLAKISWRTLENFGAKSGFLSRVGSQKAVENWPPAFSELDFRFLVEQTLQKRCYFGVRHPKCWVSKKRLQLIFFPNLFSRAGCMSKLLPDLDWMQLKILRGAHSPKTTLF